jgi:hypothetical protein
MESGVMAADHVLRSLQVGDTSRQGLKSYGIELSQKYQTPFRWARFFRKWMRTPWLTLGLVKLLKYT